MKKVKTANIKHNDCWNTIGIWSSTTDKCDRLLEAIHCRNCDVFTQAGRNVFERTPPPGYILQWRNEVASHKKVKDKRIVGVLIFRISTEWYALPAKSLQEIVAERAIHKVPHNDNPNILGIVNVGGETNICYSLKNLFEVEDIVKEIKIYQRLIVVDDNGQRYVFPVSEISGMAHYSEADVIPAPATLGSNKSTYVNGIFTYQKKQIAILDIKQVCQVLENNHI